MTAGAVGGLLAEMFSVGALAYGGYTLVKMVMDWDRYAGVRDSKFSGLLADTLEIGL